MFSSSVLIITRLKIVCNFTIERKIFVRGGGPGFHIWYIVIWEKSLLGRMQVSHVSATYLLINSSLFWPLKKLMKKTFCCWLFKVESDLSFIYLDGEGWIWDPRWCLPQPLGEPVWVGLFVGGLVSSRNQWWGMGHGMRDFMLRGDLQTRMAPFHFRQLLYLFIYIFCSLQVTSYAIYILTKQRNKTSISRSIQQCNTS